MNGDALDRILVPDPPPFALLYRPERAGADRLEVLIGDVSTAASLDRIPVRERPDDATGEVHDVLAMIPYRQLDERGFECVDDGSPLITMAVRHQEVLPLAAALTRIPAVPATLSDSRFDIDDDEYAGIVERVVTEEIGRGEGANFVVKRTYTGRIEQWTPAAGLSFFRKLLERENGAYWTFVVHTGDRTFVGASPERHVSLHDGTAVMNPISGTYRYPPSGSTLSGVLDFLADTKEIDELYMTVDEELKMMSQVCHDRVRVRGPGLKEMARLAHTEYFIEGDSDRPPSEILAMTLFAPTVTGSPVENACRVIRRYEPAGRRYYSGVVALVGSGGDGRPALDSAILIRTAEIDADGGLRIGVGATLVRGSDPATEAAETRVKAAGLLAALDATPSPRLGAHPRVRAALSDRNRSIAAYWLTGDGADHRAASALAGRTALVVDAEDTFTSMIGHQLRSIGLDVTIRRFDEPADLGAHDLVVMGPGPGDPRDATDPKIARLHSSIRELLARRLPFLAVCLSHQVLSRELGFTLARLPVPNQGVQREVDLFGELEKVGFYNTFTARSDHDSVSVPGIGEVAVSRGGGEVHALRGPFFASTQFHAESVLTRDGLRITAESVSALLGGSAGVLKLAS